jgi:XTP/dITP diphosphohydrolase
MISSEALIFATNNAHKLTEIKEALQGKIAIAGLSDIGCAEDIPETADTLEGNALQKARYIYEKYGKDCFADDTGLEVEALEGRPGVYSARYAGEGKSFEDNMNKILEELQGQTNRAACFRTVIALIHDGKEYLFEGKVCGDILTEKHGTQGFGYDPLFRPEGFERTFAEMSLSEKNIISHRARAVQAFLVYWQNL